MGESALWVGSLKEVSSAEKACGRQAGELDKLTEWLKQKECKYQSNQAQFPP